MPQKALYHRIAEESIDTARNTLPDHYLLLFVLSGEKPPYQAGRAESKGLQVTSKGNLTWGSAPDLHLRCWRIQDET